jgi:hypothetical protein
LVCIADGKGQCDQIRRLKLGFKSCCDSNDIVIGIKELCSHSVDHDCEIFRYDTIDDATIHIRQDPNWDVRHKHIETISGRSAIFDHDIARHELREGFRWDGWL